MRSLLSSLLASSLRVLSCSLPIAPQRLALLRALYLPLSHFNPYPAVVFSFHSKIQNSIARTTPSHGSIYLRTSLLYDHVKASVCRCKSGVDRVYGDESCQSSASRRLSWQLFHFEDAKRYNAP